MLVRLESQCLIPSGALLSFVGVPYGWESGQVKLEYTLQLVDKDCQVDRCMRYR